MDFKDPFTVFVEGNVGSGKSTFLNFLKLQPGLEVLSEPVELWTNFHGYNLLDLKFKEPKLFQFPFQSLATLNRLRQHLQATSKPIKIMERSLLTARRCFVACLNENGLLHDGMFHILEEWYDFVNDHHPIRCDAILYLRTKPATAFDRIQNRAREEETLIDLKYLTQLHDRHETLLLENHQQDHPKVIILDADKNFEDIQSEYDKCFAEIKKLFSEKSQNKNISI